MKPHFRLFGIPVRVELFFFLVVGFLGWSSQRPGVLLIAWVLVAFVSILWHEMGHAFAFRAFGYPPAIVLHGFGGATSSLSPERLSPKRDIAISLAGPAAGMALGGLVYAATRYFDLAGTPASEGDFRLQVIIADLLFVNIAWGIFNLVPMLPLDGGRVMAASLDLVTNGRGETPALIVSLVVGAAIAVAALATGNTWPALLVLFLGLNNLTTLQQKRRLAPQKDNLENLREGYEALDRRDLETASRRAAAVLEDPKSPEIKASATHLLMWTQMGQGRFQDAARTGEASFAERPEAGLAYNVARAWAKAGWPNEALNWLGEATDLGYRNVEDLDQDPDLASVRGTSDYDRVRDRMTGRAEVTDSPSAATTGQTTTGQTTSGQGEHPEPARPAPKAREPGRLTVVKAILAINLAVFAAQLLQPSLTAEFGQSPLDIARGQWYRLFSPMLLHADFIHIGFNSFALWIYGPNVETVFGRVRFLAIYVLAGFSGAVASYAFGDCPSLGVGASGAIFGIIGALLVFSFFRRQSRAGAANLQGILLIVALNLFIGFTVPQIDNFAHMGGLAGGILLGAAFDSLQRLRAAGRIFPAVSFAGQAIAAVAVTSAAAFLALYRTLNFTCG